MLPVGKIVDRRAYLETITDVITSDTADFFSGGYLRTSCSREWRNVMEIAPQIVAAVTNPSALVTAIHPCQLANIVRFATAVARDPSELGRASISIGFGGSIDEQAPARLPAYLIPGVEILEGLYRLYRTRRSAAAAGRSTKSQSSNREMAALEREFGIPHARILPTLRVVSGTHMALALNYEGEHDRVIRRMKTNSKILGEWVRKYHPAIEQHVQYIDDIPLDMLSAGQLTQLAYFMDLLDEAANVGSRAGASTDDRTAALVLQALQVRGSHQNRHMTKRESAAYAAMHTLVFNDDNRLCPVRGSDDRVEGFKLTIGGRAERLFNEVRLFIAARATPEGYRSYLLDLVGNESLRHRDAIGKLLSKVESHTVANLINELDAGFNTPCQGKKDHSELAIWLISTIGRQRPVYYYDPRLDVSYGSDAADHVTFLQSLTAHDSNEEKVIESIAHDYDVLRRHEREYSRMTPNQAAHVAELSDGDPSAA